MSAADDAAPVSVAEAKLLFDDLRSAPALVIAVSGGPDSTALLVLAARWRAALKNGPELLAVTVDHGLRPQSAGEARAVKQLAARLGVQHRTLRWTGRKPSTGLQEQARLARYRLLVDAACEVGARHVLTAHTLDDQAETVLLRIARGSGLTGLRAMARETQLAHITSERGARAGGVVLVRPLLDLPKARLIATLAAMGMSFADDPSNRDPRFTRPRLRGLMPTLAGEGLDARRFAQLARRLRRADAAIESAVDAAAIVVSDGAWGEQGPFVLDARKFAALPAEISLRLLGRAIAQAGDEGPVELGKLESLHQALENAGPAASRLRRTLAGAMVTLSGGRLAIEPAPPRSSPSRHGRKALTTRKHGASDASRRR